jgi:hypothetical protein
MAALTSGNAVLEVGYVASGVRLMREPARRGDGLGIVVQSAFLLWLDARHAVRFAALARTDRSADAPDRP